LIEWITKRDSDLGLYLAAAVAVIFTAMMAVQAGVTVDGLWPFIEMVGKVIIAAGVLIFVFHKLRGSRLMGLVANFLVIAALGYFLTGVAQMMTGNRWSPPLANAACLFGPFQRGCPLSPDYSGAVVADASAEAVPEDPDAAPILGQITRVNEDGETVSESLVLEKIPFAPPNDNLVLVQFAGGMTRDEVVVAATSLVSAGWNVPDFESGGERTPNAAKLNEIRYFNSADKEAAQELARSFAVEVGWVAAEAFALRDLSNAGLSPQSPHQFEIWTSQN